MNVALVIRQRLEQLELEQRDLANAAQVTESYVSQLLGGKKSPPAPSRTDIYDKMEQLLRLPDGELARNRGNTESAAPVLATILVRREIAWIDRVQGAGAATSFVVEPLP